MVLASQTHLAQHIGFGIVAAIMIVGALRVVTSNNVVHAALWLVAVMSGAAAQYQVLVYVGAVMVLFLFGTMLTRARIGAEPDLNNKSRAVGAAVALVLAATLGWVLIDTFHRQKLADGPVVTTAQVSDAIFTTYSLPFWALSVVLTAAAIGAIVLARRD
jgi:NADH-quinone oxidoreductase subunit J